MTAYRRMKRHTQNIAFACSAKPLAKHEVRAPQNAEREAGSRRRSWRLDLRRILRPLPYRHDDAIRRIQVGTIARGEMRTPNVNPKTRRHRLGTELVGGQRASCLS